MITSTDAQRARIAAADECVFRPRRKQTDARLPAVSRDIALAAGNGAVWIRLQDKVLELGPDH